MVLVWWYISLHFFQYSPHLTAFSIETYDITPLHVAQSSLRDKQYSQFFKTSTPSANLKIHFCLHKPSPPPPAPVLMQRIKIYMYMYISCYIQTLCLYDKQPSNVLVWLRLYWTGTNQNHIHPENVDVAVRYQICAFPSTVWHTDRTYYCELVVFNCAFNRMLRLSDFLSCIVSEIFRDQICGNKPVILTDMFHGSP
jgi:hypothetical protein